MLEDYAGGIAGSVSGMYQHYNPDYGAKDYYVCVEISGNINNADIECGGNYAGGIVGKALNYVNTNAELWDSNKNYGNVSGGKLYN